MKEVDFFVFNTLNLINCKLGDAYLLNNFNPFEGNSNKIMPSITKNMEEKIVDFPNFIYDAPKTVLTALKKSHHATKILIKEISSLHKMKPNERSEDLLSYLKIREKLLGFAENSKNVILAFKNAYVSCYKASVKYSQLLENSFYKEYSHEATLHDLTKIIRGELDVENINKQTVAKPTKNQKLVFTMEGDVVVDKNEKSL